MPRLEETILKNLIYSSAYTRKVFPFLKEEYFTDLHERNVFKEIASFIETYHNPPTYEAMVITITESHTLNEQQVESAIKILEDIHKQKDEPTDPIWLVAETEKFCQDKSIYNAVLEAVAILDDRSEKKSKGAIPELLSKALAVSFDNSVGHDYLLSADDRWDYYHKKEKKIPFDIDLFNLITDGGFSEKTLNIIIAGTGVGKTLIMCHIAAAAASLGKNVLYITMEMAEERIAERIDTNLMNISMKDLKNISKSEYDRRIERLRSQVTGKFIIKEYPTASASVIHFRQLIQELRLKKEFKPDMIIVDYMNICTSSRIKMGGSVNSYTYIKSIAEELRGLGVEFGVPVVSATQTTRGGYDNSDLGLTDTSESFGVPATADFMMAAITTEELEKVNQIMFKQLKNRYEDVTRNRRFVVGIDKSKMKLYNLDPSAQESIQGGITQVKEEKKILGRLPTKTYGLKV